MRHELNRLSLKVAFLIQANLTKNEYFTLADGIPVRIEE